jgi:hypothetical protein
MKVQVMPHVIKVQTMHASLDQGANHARIKVWVFFVNYFRESMDRFCKLSRGSTRPRPQWNLKAYLNVFGSKIRKFE